MAIPTNIHTLLSGNVVEWARIEFKTTWDDVCNAKEWVVSIIETKSKPKVTVSDSEPFRYCLESTAQYHEIVVRAWRGEPELINPVLAGATLKKTVPI